VGIGTLDGSSSPLTFASPLVKALSSTCSDGSWTPGTDYTVEITGSNNDNTLVSAMDDFVIKIDAGCDCN